MSRENPIGLADLIDEVKRELLAPERGEEGTAPLFSVDEVVLELQVTLSKEATGGVKVYVVEVGGGVSRDDVQTVKVTLTPLLSKEERIRVYKERYPDLWQTVEEVSAEAGIKGSDKQSLGDVFGG